MGLFAAFAVLALLNTAVCYALYRLAAFFQQKHWEQSTIGGMPDLPKLRRRFFIFFLLMNIVQITAFAKGKTPYPKWCFVFNMLIGLIDIIAMRIAGNRPWAYALSTGWLSFGSLVTFVGLLMNLPKAERNERT